jgi:hypothetical protein
MKIRICKNCGTLYDPIYTDYCNACIQDSWYYRENEYKEIDVKVKEDENNS